MDQEHALKTLKTVKERGPKRNFSQSVDLVINLKDIDLKKTDQQLDLYVTLHYPHGKDVKVCGLVGPELEDESKKHCDHTIKATEFSKLTPKDIKTLAKAYDYFVAQANVMPQVAQTFGRVLGPRGKMPNPKAGCVVAPKTNLEPLVKRLGQTVRVLAKKDPVLHLKVGSEDQDEQEVADNISFLYKQISNNLPLEENNIKNALLKLTMGKPEAL